ncbi:MAG: biotin/lipoyl-binding protein [Acidobacteria bacterium]|nr:biotin/lipoyl-binding protein [Acidobacteriota bacterium]
MKLTAELDGAEQQIELRREGERVWARVDGRSYELSVRETEAGAYLLIDDGRVYECRVESTHAQPDAVQVHVRTQTYALTLSDPKRLRGGHGGAGGHGVDGSAQIVAPMPGKIVRVLVEVGAAVKAGDGIIVVEAMKMQNEMKAPRDGVVSEIHAASGATVNAGDILATIE